MSKILVVDDEVQIRTLLSRMLELEGYEVGQAGDCRTALKQLEFQSPDVVLCDVFLPDGNGVDLVASIKKTAPNVEIILLTAHGNIPDGVQAIKNGAFDYITKGDDNNKIIPLVSRAVEKARMNVRLEKLEKKVIVAITDAKKGAARVTADKEGYKSFIIPDNVGGRFSVLTPVGLLPIAVAGYDIIKLVEGARTMEALCSNPDTPFAENPAAVYAATRNALYQDGKKIEILVNFQPKLHYVSEWWKQLYGESEGKENKGIFPASVDFSTDLHSMGQWIQEGERTIFETVISVEKPNHKLEVPSDEANLDGLNFLAGKRVDEVNKMAELGTQLAHVDGGVPNMRLIVPELNEFYLGEIIYFFEIGCGISGYILGVNPFNQPGVEAYKKNMFALLNKPGYEEESKAIQARL